MYIFLDESGNFSKEDHGQYFVVGSFTVGNPRRTNKEFRKWINNKFPRKMSKQSEVKWSQRGISNDFRLRTLRHIAKLDVRIRFGYLLRDNIPNAYRSKGKVNGGQLYTNILGEVLEQYMPTNDKEVHIFCDQRPLKGMTKEDFEMAIKSHLLPLCSPDTTIQVEMVNSSSSCNIQIVDWISGAIAHYLEKKKNGDEFYKVLKNNFLDQGKEFFI